MARYGKSIPLYIIKGEIEMKKREFLRKLSKRLDYLSKREVDDILDYYDELIEDTIDRTGKREEDVIYDLGPIDEIVRKVNPNRTYEKIRYEEDEPIRPSKKRYYARKKESSPRTLAVIIILLLLFPVWFAVCTVLLSLMIASIAAGIGIILGGGFSIFGGIMNMSSHLTNAIFQVGTGVLLIGVSFLLVPLLLKICSLIFKLFIKFFRWLFGIASDRREVIYEN